MDIDGAGDKAPRRGPEQGRESGGKAVLPEQGRESGWKGAPRLQVQCIHPRQPAALARPLRSIWCGIFAGYSAFEPRFNQPIDSGLVP
jgi:hypothetical protein